MIRPFRLALLLMVAVTWLAASASAQMPPQQGDPNAPPGFPPVPPLVGPPVKLELHAPAERIAPGDRFPLALRVRMAPTWHINTPDPPKGDGYFPGAYPTTITLAAPANFVVGRHQWPEAHDVVMARGTPAEQKVLCIDGDRNIYLPITVPADFPAGPVELVVTVDYQTCDYHKCLPPKLETLRITLEIDPNAPPATWESQRQFAEYDATAAAAADSAAPVEPVAPIRTAESDADEGASLNVDELGIGFSINTRGFLGIILVTLLAALAGFLLNLTPCVLPIIPIKIMGLTQAAGNPKRALLLGSVMAAGLISFWIVIGILIISLETFTAISDLFRMPEFVVGVGVFIFAMGFGMLGVFTVQLPKAVYMINPNHESLGGAFFFGVMTAILSTPCTAPFMGAVTAWAAAANSSVLVMLVFGAVGAGMALPYLVLSAFPRLVSKVPRTGPASELIKQTLGLLMIAVSFFFLGTGVISLGSKYPGLGLSLYWWVIVVIVALAGLWLFTQTRAITTRRGPVVATAVGSILVTAGLIWWSIGQTNLARHAAGVSAESRREQLNYIRDLEKAVAAGGGSDVIMAKRIWSHYTPEDYDAAIRAGKTVLLEFDAVW